MVVYVQKVLLSYSVDVFGSWPTLSVVVSSVGSLEGGVAAEAAAGDEEKKVRGFPSGNEGRDKSALPTNFWMADEKKLIIVALYCCQGQVVVVADIWFRQSDRVCPEDKKCGVTFNGE